MKQIELYRHTDNDGDVLSADGVRAAVTLGARLDGEYQVAVSTGAQRATQTLACLLAGLGEQVPDGVVVEDGLRSDREDRWREIYQQTQSGHLDAFRASAPDFVEEQSGLLGEALRRVLDLLDDGNCALVVGHSPTNEAAVLGLTRQTIGPMGKGDGVRITADGGVYKVEALEGET